MILLTTAVSAATTRAYCNKSEYLQFAGSVGASLGVNPRDASVGAFMAFVYTGKCFFLDKEIEYTLIKKISDTPMGSVWEAINRANNETIYVGRSDK